MINTRTTALITTIVLAAISWVVVVIQMNGMDMGVATRLGSFRPFMVTWTVMMSAMMLPGAIPAILRFARISDSLFAVLLFVGSYLAVWALLGIAIYAFYRPHGPFVAGVIVVGAGIYELMPLKRIFRKYCCEGIHSGFGFGLFCMGSCIGLMLMQVALGLMSIKWMLLITILNLVQKLLPARASIDVPLALIIFGMGMLIIMAPSEIQGRIVPNGEVIIDCGPQARYQDAPPLTHTGYKNTAPRP